MSGNTVTLTFAGDSEKLETSFKNVGSAADGMKHKVSEAGEGFEKAREGFDTTEQRAMGFRDTITGVQDSVGGFSTIMKGDVAGGLLQMGAGIGDLASGFANLLVPMAKTVATTVASTAATVAHGVASFAVSAATKAWAAAQWLLDAAMSANPLGLIIAGIIILIGVIVLIATKTTWFQTIWHAVWDFLKAVGAWFAGPFKDFFVNAWNTITGAFSGAWAWIKGIFTSGVNWINDKVRFVITVFSTMIGQIKGIFSKVKDFITAPFKAAFNFVSDAWNHTIGSLHWTVPSWVPFIGGDSISAPKLPHFHTGGIVSGALGSETLAVLRAGEQVTAGSNSAGPMVLELRSDGSRWTDFLISELKRAVSRQGGNPLVVFGNSRG